jgi:hypothetical protein
VQTPKRIKELEELAAQPLLMSKMQSLNSLKARLAWMDIWYLVYMATNDIAGLLFIGKKEVKLYEKNPSLKIINPVAYLVSYTHLSNAEGMAGNYEAALKVMDNLGQLLVPSAQITKARVDSIGFYVELSSSGYLVKLKRYSEVASPLEKLTGIMDKRPAA